MKTFALAALAITASATVTPIEVAEIAEGTLIGFFNSAGYPDIASCITDAEDVAIDAEKAFNDFSDKSVSGVIQGLKDLGDMVNEIKVAMTDCEQISDNDWSEITNAVDTMSNPLKFAYHVGEEILINGVNIYHDIESAQSNWESQKYEAFGENVGDVLEKVLLGEVEPINMVTYYGLSKVEVIKIIEGMLMGALKAESFGDLASCITDVDEAVVDINKAIQDFRSEDSTGVKSGLSDLEGAIIEIAKAVKDCSDIKNDWEKMVEMATAFSNPMSYAYHVGKDLLVNGVDIYNDITDAMRNWEDASYESFGENVGDALAKLLIGEEDIVVIQ